MKAFKSEKGKDQVLGYYEMLRKELTVPYEGLNISTSFGNTFVLVAGEKTNPPIFLLHGSMMNSAMWIGDINKLSQAYRVYAPDMPGEPGKSDEEQLAFNNDDYSDWLLELFNALSVDKAIVEGLSLGAWLATKFSILHPEKVSKLVLLCPAGIGSQNEEFKNIAFGYLMKGEAGVDELFTLINGGPIPEIILTYQKLISMHFNARQEEIPIFSDEELTRLTMPSILFVGAKDILLRSEETAERYGRLIPSAEVVVLPERGHSLSGLVEEVLSFINSSTN